jgi:hypothetical protein
MKVIISILQSVVIDRLGGKIVDVQPTTHETITKPIEYHT